MTDQGDRKPNPEERPASSPPPPPFVPLQNQTVLGGAPEGPPHNEPQETKEPLRQTRTIEWLQLGVNSVLAGVGIIAICIYGGQLKVFRDQLNEMIKATKAAEKGADAAASAAKTADATLKEIRRSGSDTHALAESALAQAKATNDLAQQAKRQAKATEIAIANARNQFRISVRPWVGIADEPGSIATGPITFDGDSNASVQYGTRIKNFGPQAAQDIQPVAQLLITEDIEAIYTSQQETCSSFVQPGIGILLFQGKGRVSGYSVSVAPKSKMVSKTYDGKLQAWLIVCVHYSDQFGCPYRTPVIYNLVDPQNLRSVRFFAVPNSKVEGVFRVWRSGIEPRKQRKYYEAAPPSLGEPCPK